MVLQRIGKEEKYVWGKETEVKSTKHFGEQRLASGEVEKISDASGNVSIELRRKASLDRKDGRVGDNYCMLPNFDVYTVFDGVSGSASDSRSSFGASKILEKIWKKNLTSLGKDIDDLSLQEMHDVMLNVVSDLQRKFLEYNKKNPEALLFTTFSMVKIFDDQCLVVSVGDSPVFLQTQGGLEQITIAQDTIREGTKDDFGNYIPASIDEWESGELNFDKADLQARQKNPGIIRNNPTSLIGKDNLQIDFYVRRFEKGQRILLATDGAVKKNDRLGTSGNETLTQLADTLVTSFDKEDDATILLLE